MFHSSARSFVGNRGSRLHDIECVRRQLKIYLYKTDNSKGRRQFLRVEVKVMNSQVPSGQRVELGEGPK